MKIIKLSRGYTTTVSDIDYDWLNRFSWHVQGYVGDSKTKYAVTNVHFGGGQWNFYMHQLITDRMFEYDDETDLIPDHKNMNGLDNQRHNLRMITRNLNKHNALPYGVSKYRGVCWHKVHNRWQASIRSNYKLIFLGYFDEEIDAAEAYDRQAKKIYGTDTILNFKEEN